MQKLENGSVIQYLDSGISRLAKWFSYLGGISLVIMALIAVVNVISSKVFGKAIANINELIDYMLIAVVYCCVADCQLNSGGLIHVDIFTRKFPEQMNTVIRIVGSIMGAGIYAFAAYKAFYLLKKHFTYKTLAASTISSFQIWPFTLLFIVGSFFLAFALLWSCIRIFFIPSDNPVLPSEGVNSANSPCKLTSEKGGE